MRTTSTARRRFAHIQHFVSIVLSIRRAFFSRKTATLIAEWVVPKYTDYHYLQMIPHLAAFYRVTSENNFHGPDLINQFTTCALFLHPDKGGHERLFLLALRHFCQLFHQCGPNNWSEASVSDIETLRLDYDLDVKALRIAVCRDRGKTFANMWSKRWRRNRKRWRRFSL